MLESESSPESSSVWVSKQKLNTNTFSPQDSMVYANGYRTCIHISGLLQVFGAWVGDIGYSLMGITEPNTPHKYFDWVSRNWIFTYTFIEGFHADLVNSAKRLDKNISTKTGFSHFEALHKARSSNASFDRASQELKERDISHQNTIKKIDKSIEQGFFLEAITLQECLISNCLFNLLDAKGVEAKKSTFQVLIKKAINNSKDDTVFLKKIDTWRKSRNKSIHGFIESTLSSFSASEEEFYKFSRTTALEGRNLCEEICNWYLNKSVDFIETEFCKDKINYH